jgi:hypothetical protein
MRDGERRGGSEVLGRLFGHHHAVMEGVSDSGRTVSAW